MTVWLNHHLRFWGGKLIAWNSSTNSRGVRGEKDAQEKGEKKGGSKNLQRREALKPPLTQIVITVLFDSYFL